MKRTVKSIVAGVGMLALAAGVLAPVLSAQAQGQGPRQRMMGKRGPGGPGGPMGPGRGGPMGQMGFGLRQLDLTEAQKNQLAAIRDGHKADFQAIAERMREARQNLRAAIETAPANEAAVRQASAAVAAVESDAAVLRATVHSEVFNILTDAQKAKAAELRAKGEERRAAALKHRQERLQERIKARQGQPKGEF